MPTLLKMERLHRLLSIEWGGGEGEGNGKTEK